MRSMIVSMLWLLCVGAVQAEVYRWVDSQGRVQYSDQPPTGVDARKMTTKPAAGVKGAPGIKSYQEQDQESRKRSQDAADQAGKDAATAQQVEVRQKNCAQAQSQLAALQSGARLSRVNDKGAREVLDDKGIEAATVDAKKAAADWCG